MRRVQNVAALRELLVSFGVKVDDKPLVAAAGRVDALAASVGALGGVLGAGLAAVGLGALKTQVDDLAAENLDLSKAAVKAGVGFKQFQAISYTTGLSTESLTVLFRKMQQNVASAGGSADDATQGFDDLDGSMSKVSTKKQAGEVFKNLGIDVDDAGWKASSNADKFERIADSLRAVQDPAKRTLLATRALGRSGTDLLPFLEKSPEAIHALAEEFENVGGITGEQSVKLKAYSAANKSLGLATRAVRIELLTALVPALTSAARAFANGVGWIKQHVDVGRLLQIGLGLIATKFVASTLAMGNFTLAGVQSAGRMALAWGRTVLPLVALFLVLEDLIGFLDGDGNTAIGKFLQLVFGEAEGKSIALQASTDFAQLMAQVDQAHGLMAKFNVVNNAVWDNVISFITKSLPEAWSFFWQDMNRLFLTGETGFFGLLTQFGALFYETIYATLRGLGGVGDAIANASGLTGKIKGVRDRQSAAMTANREREGDLSTPVSRPEGDNLQGGLASGGGFHSLGPGTVVIAGLPDVPIPKPNAVTQNNAINTQVYVADVGSGKDIGGKVSEAQNQALIKSLQDLNNSIPTKNK